MAVAGILAANVLVFFGQFVIPPERAAALSTVAADRVVLFLEHVFVDGKFYSVFSLLFGIGFGLQLVRASDAGGNFARLWRRRMVGLFVLGLVHAVFLSTIDILVQYALLGALLYALRKASDRRLLTIAALLLVVPVLFTALAVALGDVADFAGVSPAEAREAIAAYAHGTLRAFLVQRLRDLVGYYVWVGVSAGYPIVAMFLLGYVVARRGIPRALDGNRALLRRVFAIALPIAIVFCTTREVLDEGLLRAPTRAPRLWILHALLRMVGNPALCLSYATGFTLLFLRPSAGFVTTALARLGRTALSQYVLQSLVMSALFFGARLYGSVSPTAAMGIGVALYAGQLVLVTFWVQRYRQGPLEALWRRWTYAGSAV